MSKTVKNPPILELFKKQSQFSPNLIKIPFAYYPAAGGLSFCNFSEYSEKLQKESPPAAG